jgi:uncharacterized OsmC-like protein
MDADQLRALQSPIKQRYRDDPSTARVVMHASGTVQSSQLACFVDTSLGQVVAGLHPAAGGSGELACSGDMLLQALVACSGVTLSAVATAMGIEIRSANITAQAEMDFRGTMGIDKSVPVGITSLRLDFEFDSPAEDSQLKKLVELTERYCVVLQTLAQPASLTTNFSRVN